MIDNQTPTTNLTATTRKPRQDPHYAKRWRHDRNHGIRRYADASPVRQHIQTLRDRHASYRAIADIAGVSTYVVCQVASGQKLIQSVNAARILAVTPDRIFHRDGAEDFVPSIGAVRRLQALAALGHTSETIAAAMGPGATTDVVRNVRRAPGTWISRLNYDRARIAYDALWDQPGASPFTRAAARRYPPPLAWDDDTIDDPAAKPQHQLGQDEVSPIKRVHLEDIHELATDGLTLTGIAQRLGVSKDAVSMCLRRDDDTDTATAVLRRLHYNGLAADEIPA